MCEIDEELRYMVKNNFSSGNNNKFRNYTGNVSYCLNKHRFHLKKNQVHYFTCENATFNIDKDGYIDWKCGKWLDGIFYGKFQNGVWYNGQFKKGQFIDSIWISGKKQNIKFKNSTIVNNGD